MSLPVGVHIDLCSWLALTGKGILQNESYVIPPGTFHDRIHPTTERPYLIFCNIMFDGLSVGTVSYQIVGSAGSLQAGYAMMQGMPSERQIINDRGRHLDLTIINTQTSSIVCNVMFTAVEAQVWEGEVLPALDLRSIGG